MDKKHLRTLLCHVENGDLNVDEALERLRHLAYEDLGFAKVDHHRCLRQGFPEVIFCPGKTTEQIVQIARRMADTTANVLATRATPEVFAALSEVFPDAEYHELAKAVVVNRDQTDCGRGMVLVVAAGTADLPVAEEAALTVEVMGSRVERLYDVGVAGIHRLFDNHDKLMSANVLVVVAGMEGALASVVGGLVDKPIIAVPTSVGYGANFGGLSALLTMLNSCATGVSVVNIDNGFGGGYSAALINRVQLEE
ncbi:nickel pincer cofactor biosynthesis protein LarB [Dethiobacter alkaliphilus]|uniref:nickel pincer cofactor biosynthesis protein LarB n=1 Tax=Dethiobacter alkaliphilus TaxID=427926 RepID=UPI002227AB46|nr:nickel pincer cofactor biosynthesis protein LarB [Dethiobacter alkaliphilus]MCW3488877.1 nickel pincer cofactor biosynthesis protein LarB [Dethiobacter alkaliphilus]